MIAEVKRQPRSNRRPRLSTKYKTNLPADLLSRLCAICYYDLYTIGVNACMKERMGKSEVFADHRLVP